MGEVHRKDRREDTIIAVREWHPLLWQIQNERDMGKFPSLLQLRMQIEQDQRKEKEKTRDNIIRIVCALVSSGAEYDTFSDAIDEAIGLYNEINERI